MLVRISDRDRTVGRCGCLRKMSGDEYRTCVRDLGACEQVTRSACGAVSVVVRMVKGHALGFDVRARIRSLPPLEKGREGQKYLRDGEEENRRPPQRAREQPGLRHERHTRRSLRVPVRASTYSM